MQPDMLIQEAIPSGSPRGSAGAFPPRRALLSLPQMAAAVLAGVGVGVVLAGVLVRPWERPAAAARGVGDRASQRGAAGQDQRGNRGARKQPAPALDGKADKRGLQAAPANEAAATGASDLQQARVLLGEAAERRLRSQDLLNRATPGKTIDGDAKAGYMEVIEAYKQLAEEGRAAADEAGQLILEGERTEQLCQYLESQAAAFAAIEGLLREEVGRGKSLTASARLDRLKKHYDRTAALRAKAEASLKR